MKQLTDFADCVMPIDNQSLVNIVNKVESHTSKSTAFATSLRKADPSKVISGTGTVISSASSVSALKRCEKTFD